MERRFVVGILRGEVERVGAQLPKLGPEGHLSLLRRVLGPHRPWRHPERQAKADGFGLVQSNFCGKCGGSTARELLIPVMLDDQDRNLVTLHEWHHAMVRKLRQWGLREADFWRITACHVWWANCNPKGVALYPQWFVDEIPHEIAGLQFGR